MNKQLSKENLSNMEIGDVIDIYFEDLPQVSVTCTQNCGFKHYIVLGNSIEEKIFFEGNSEEARNKCITELYFYLTSLEDEYGWCIDHIKLYEKEKC